MVRSTMVSVPCALTCVRCFFFQAEDGIRDLTVTGVQTCALPILILVNALGHARERLAAQRVRAHRIVARIEQWRATEHRAWAEQWSGAQPHRLRRDRESGG